VGESTPAKETRIVIFGLIGLAVVIVGYCGVKAVQVGRTAYGVAIKEAATVRNRMDTTFHVQDGSAVYLDKASIAPLARVIVIRGDTALSSQHRGAVESAMVAAFRHDMVMYTMGTATDSAAASRLLATRAFYGTLQGRYDGTDPVRIDLTEGTMPSRATMPDGFLKVTGRQQTIPLYFPK
jgi:hypothetical protein